MNASQIYTLIAIVTLAVVALVLYRLGWRKEQKGLTPIAGLAFGFILAGIVFSEERFISYGLMGLGVVLAVVDIITQTRRKKSDNSSG
jgi:ABC-type Fe3+-siderophore transport system permease subunit